MEDDDIQTQQQELLVTSLFDAIRQMDENGREYWDARALARLLGYTRYANFTPVLRKAEEACEQSGEAVADHFPHARKMITMGTGAQRFSDTMHLSRYGCYLAVKNSDPTGRPVVSLVQNLSRFLMEIRDTYSELIERVEHTELQIKELETEVANLRDIHKTQMRYEEVMAEAEAVRIEIQEAKAEMEEIRAENRKITLEFEQKYAGPIKQLEEEFACTNKLFASDDLSPEQKFNLWVLRQRYREAR